MSSNVGHGIQTYESGVDLGLRHSRRQLFMVCLVVLVLSPLLDLTIWFITHRITNTRHPSVLNIARIWVTSWSSGVPGGDSWDPMRSALEWFQQHPDGRLYQQLFFIDRIKFIYPPTSLLPLHALSLLGVAPSDAVWNRVNWCFIAVNALATGAFAFVLARRSPRFTPLALQFAIVGTLGALLFFPLMHAFRIGQVQVWINAMFALSALAWLGGRKLLVGVLIGLICLLKPQFAMFLLWGLLRREWRFLFGWSAVVGLGLVGSLAVFGVQNHLDYVQVLRALSRTGEAYLPNQSFNGMLNRLYNTADPAVWQSHTYPSYNPTVYIGTLLTSAAILGAALLVPLRGKGASGLLDFLGAALSFTIASPLAWEHHYGILPVMYVAVMFVVLNRPPSRARWLQLATLASSFLITAHWMGGSWTLWAALALLSLMYILDFESASPAVGAIRPRRDADFDPLRSSSIFLVTNFSATPRF